MPQLNQPYTYIGEYVQLGLLFITLLAIVCFYVAPLAFVTRACALVLSIAKSPLEQFSVPFTSFGSTGALMGSTGITTIVGIYGFLTLASLFA